MKFETIFLRLFDAAYIAHQSGHDEGQAMDEERFRLIAEAEVANLNIHFSKTLLGRCGPFITACLSTDKPLQHFADVDAAAFIFLESNHRVLVTRFSLGEPDQDHFQVAFVQGDREIRDGKVRSGHRSVPPFPVGDLSETDRGFYYLASQAVYIDTPLTQRIGELPFPLSESEHVSIFGGLAKNTNISALLMHQHSG